MCEKLRIPVQDNSLSICSLFMQSVVLPIIHFSEYVSKNKIISVQSQTSV